MSAQTLYYLIGCGLLLWVGYDLINGQVYLHRLIERQLEPGLYWASILLWTFVALSFFYF